MDLKWLQQCCRAQTCFPFSQRGFQSGGGGGEAGRPDRVPETAQHSAQHEAAQPHRSALSVAGLFLSARCTRRAPPGGRQVAELNGPDLVETLEARPFLSPKHLCTVTRSTRLRPQHRWTDNGGGGALLLKGCMGEESWVTDQR